MLVFALKVAFSIVCIALIAVILSNLITGIQAGISLAYLAIIDLCFPIIGLFAVWKFTEEEREPTDTRCFKMHMLMLVFWVWALIWVIVGFILLLARAHVFTYDATPGAVAMLGDPNQPVSQTVIITSSIQLVLAFIALVLGIMCWKRMTPRKKEVQGGFV